MASARQELKLQVKRRDRQQTALFYLHFICSGRKFCVPFCQPVSAELSSCSRSCRGLGNSWLNASKQALYGRQIYVECRRRRYGTTTTSNSNSSISSSSAGNVTCERSCFQLQRDAIKRLRHNVVLCERLLTSICREIIKLKLTTTQLSLTWPRALAQFEFSRSSAGYLSLVH